MYRSSFNPQVLRAPKLNGRVLTRIIEVDEGSYSINSKGFIRNDFSELQASNDAIAMERVLQKMQEITNNEPDNSKKSFDEIVAMVRPRWCQSPAELDRFELYCIDNALDTYAKLKKLDDDQKEAIAKAKGKELDELRVKLKADLTPVVEPKSE